MPLFVDKEAVRMEILMAFERCIEKKPMTKITLRDIAEEAGMSQAELSVAARTSQPNICNYESGKYIPKYDIACRLATVFGCDVPEVMSWFKEEGA